MDIVLEKGKTISVKIVAKWTKDKINYIVYEDNNDLLASRYEIIDGSINLLPIESEEEWDYIDNYLAENFYEENE